MVLVEMLGLGSIYSQGKSEAELKEEEELQLVLALSKSEADEKEAAKKKATSDLLAGYTNGTAAGVKEERREERREIEQQPPELEKYLDRDYWEQQSRSTAKAAMAPTPMVEREQVQVSPPSELHRAENEELDDFTMSLRTQLEIFVNRMKSNSSRGRPIATDSSVQTLFMNVMTMHGKLVKYIAEQEEERVMYEGLQDKLNQVKDARAALDALREEEAERKRLELEEAERQRQIQLAAKLEVMRKKKAEYLEYQRQVALQRMADQEREVAKIAEANKAAYMQQQGMYNMYLPYAGGYQPQPGMQPPGQPLQYPGMPQPYPGYQPGLPPQPGMQAGIPPQPTMQHGIPAPQSSMQSSMAPQSTLGSMPGVMGQPGMGPSSKYNGPNAWTSPTALNGAPPQHAYSTRTRYTAWYAFTAARNDSTPWRSSWTWHGRSSWHAPSSSRSSTRWSIPWWLSWLLSSSPSWGLLPHGWNGGCTSSRLHAASSCISASSISRRNSTTRSSRSESYLF